MHPRRVLVTGASRGIGRACALALAHSGFDISVHCRSRRELAESLVSEIEALGRRANILMFDVSDRVQTRAALEADLAAHGAYYGVVCNAGITADAAFPAMSGGDWDAVIHTNLDAFYNVLNPLVMPMIGLRAGGRIVTVASVSGLIGNRGQTNYSAAKAGVIAAGKALALELAKRKITVNCVAPGAIATDMAAGLPDEVIGAIPMRRLGTAEEVAAAVDFFMSDRASYITRQVLSVNGGLC